MMRRMLLAAVLQLLLVLLLLPCCCFHRATGTLGTQPDRSVSSKVYIVSLRSAPPVLAYGGGFAGFPATAPPASSARLGSAFSALYSATDRLNGALGGSIRKEWERQRRKWQGKGKALLRSANAQRFAAFLKRQQRNVAASAGVRPASILHSYRYISNGFAAKLSPAQVRLLQRHPAVARVRASVRLYPATTHSPSFLQLPATLWNTSRGRWGGAPAGSAGVASAAEGKGDGVVIGVIDSGIWPEHPSFVDKPGAPPASPPSTFTGACETTGDFEACTGKVVGARSIYKAFEAEAGAIDLTVDYLSPRDSFNHGSWCAGAAAGNSGVEITASTGQQIGAASGMAPNALLAIYKVLWRKDAVTASAPLADVKAAVERAILDGVDVISISLAGLYDFTDYFTDAAYANALRAGVVMVLAAGNDGRPPAMWSWRTLSNFSPFYLSVGASSIGRQFTSAVVMGNKKSLLGAGMGGNQLTAAGISLIDGLAARIGGTYEGKYCFEDALDAAKIAGKIVVCMRGTAYVWQKVKEVSKGGGVGMILINDPKGESNVYDNIPSPVPVVHLNAADGATLLAYIKKTKNPVASIPASFTVRQLPGHPLVAAFSSAGPPADPTQIPMRPSATNDILKPDIIAPGLSLWAAAAGSLESAGVVAFGLLSGTSMATPHVAGVAAMIVQRNPTWSPAQVMSAIVTSAVTTNGLGKPIRLESGAVATPWEMGAGQINPTGLLDPGLTYDLQEQDFVNFLAGQDEWLTSSLYKNRSYTPISPSNLNRPAISISRVEKNATVTRTVTNVADAPSNYTAKLVVPAGVSVVVNPPRFTIGVGENVTFSVTMKVTKPSPKFSFGSLTWVDNLGHAVRSVLAVQPLKR